MKKLRNFLFLMAGAFLLFTCTQQDELISDDLSADELKCATPSDLNVIMLPFKATMTGEYMSIAFDSAECIDAGYGCFVVVDAEGQATHMGNISTTFEFCACGPDDEAIPGYDNKYEGGTYVVKAANGNILYLFSDGGSVVDGKLPEHPDYVVSYWRDTLTVIGGTGKFKNATGTVTTDDYNSSLDPYSHHQWNGTIILPKDNKKDHKRKRNKH
jgi:hypothetical protein